MADDVTDRLVLREAIEITKAYGKVLSEGAPIIADADLLPYPKAEIKRALLIYEQHLCDLAKMHLASRQTEKLKEIDKLLNATRLISMGLNSYTDIEPEDEEDVHYFNSFDTMNDIPNEDRIQCSQLVFKYMSKGMEEELPGWTEMADSVGKKALEERQ